MRDETRKRYAVTHGALPPKVAQGRLTEAGNPRSAIDLLNPSATSQARFPRLTAGRPRIAWLGLTRPTQEKRHGLAPKISKPQDATTTPTSFRVRRLLSGEPGKVGLRTSLSVSAHSKKL